MTSIESFVGSQNSDTFDASHVSPSTGITIDGAGGVDYITGSDGSDHLHGGSEGDYLWGRNGDDYLYGGSGDDTLYGDDGKISSTVMTTTTGSLAEPEPMCSTADRAPIPRTTARPRLE